MNSGSANSIGGCRSKGSNWTKEEGLYVQVIFGLLKTTYLPLFSQSILEDNHQSENLTSKIEQYKNICIKCWQNIKSLKGLFELQGYQEFLELVFSEKILEIFLLLKNQKKIYDNIVEFYKNIAKEIFEVGNQFWLIIRQTFNHLLFIFYKKPQLMNIGFQNFIVNFTLCRELKSLDSQLQLYRIETMLPQVITKKYENLSLEEICYQGAYIRCLTLSIIEGIISNVHHDINTGAQQQVFVHQILESLEQSIVYLFNLNQKIEKSSQSEMPYSQQHRQKLRIWQSLIVFLQLLNPQIYNKDFRQLRQNFSGFDIIQQINNQLWNTIKQSHITSIRQYIEIFTIKFCLMFPYETIATNLFIETLLNANAKPQVISSYIFIAGYCMLNTQVFEDYQQTQLKKQIFDYLIGFCTSNNAHARCMAQYFVRQIYNDPIFRPFISQELQVIFNYLDRSKDVIKILKKYDQEIKQIQILIQSNGMQTILQTKIDNYGEFIHDSFINTMKEITSQLMTEIRNQDFKLPDQQDYWQKDFEFRMQNLNIQESNLEQSQNIQNLPSCIEPQIQNYQRKILPWEQIEQEKNKLKNFSQINKRNKVIVCASLIDKVPNLAGLTRTCEIMNAQALVISNKEIIKTDEFKTIAVTAEKWLPIFEIKEQDIQQYLKYQKLNGYKIIGLEQTANSKMLNTYNFEQNCILLLGKEKEGIPQEYYQILDECIEIPQFGIIRSLNVHVSGALCLWEYAKQQNSKLL